MARVVNLRRARKAAKRSEKREAAERNTAPAPSALDKARAELERRRLEAHKRDDDGAD